jgi:hypothetical protein
MSPWHIYDSRCEQGPTPGGPNWRQIFPGGAPLPRDREKPPVAKPESHQEA